MTVLTIYEPKVTQEPVTCMECQRTVSEWGAIYTERRFDERLKETSTRIVCTICRTFSRPV